MFPLQCGVGMVKHSDKNLSIHLMDINCLVDLNNFRSAPKLTNIQRKKLLSELQIYIDNSDWITVGIMAFHDFVAINALKSITGKYSQIKFSGLESLHADGTVFLKGNQKTGNVFIRSESGLGQGILITCQYEEEFAESTTFGPFPLDFFIN